jgi:hypothetical protein
MTYVFVPWGFASDDVHNLRRWLFLEIVGFLDSINVGER